MINKRSSVVLVFNSKNELALQLRASGDKSYPSHWDFSAAGGIELGEDPILAASRELKEEVGVEADLKFVLEILYTDHRSNDQLYLFKAYFNGKFSPNPQEVDEVKFFSLESINEMITLGEKFHPEFIFLWNKEIITKLI